MSPSAAAKSPLSTSTMATIADADDATIIIADADASAASTLSTLARGPLKKRRKVVDDDEDSDAPSSPSSSSECASPAMSEKLESPNTITAMTADYTQFPSLLHKLLTKENDDIDDNKDKAKNKEEDEDKDEDKVKEGKSDIIASAMEWLPHGKAWRVLRWDTLCTQVLPREFPTLCNNNTTTMKEAHHEELSKANDDDDTRDDNESSGSSVDDKKNQQFSSDEQWIQAFLKHVKSWGFEEVVVGRDRGSFRHELFQRESPESCTKMTMNSIISSASTLLSTPTYSTPTYNDTVQMIVGHGTTSSFDNIEHHTSSTPTSASSWHNKQSKSHHKVVSSIFKPRRRGSYNSSNNHHNGSNHHPSHLHVPMLPSTASTASWGGSTDTTNSHHQQYQHHHGQQHVSQHVPYPSPPGSRKTIRFRDEQEQMFSPYNHHQQQQQHRNDIAVEITPNPAVEEASPTLQHGNTGGGRNKQLFQHRGFVSRRGRRPALISRHATH